MNAFLRQTEDPVDADAARRMARRLAEWIDGASEADLEAAGPELRGLRGAHGDDGLSRTYPEGFSADAAYRAGLPDLQNGPASLIRGEDRRIEHVGISNFRLPMTVPTRSRGDLTLEASVDGTVGLSQGTKGINMSRIMRRFYDRSAAPLGFAELALALDDIREGVVSDTARLMVRLSFPVMQQALRSGLSGWQFYDVAYEAICDGETTARILHLDYVYASTCPCSLELSEHARRTRGQLAAPHSQRSVARLSVRLAEGADLAVEDLIDLARAAVPTETQVMVKREDEQAFAELNAANPIFVEDAARLFAEALGGDGRIGDYRVSVSHLESLHSHDAVAMLGRGETFGGLSVDPGHFAALSASV